MNTDLFIEMLQIDSTSGRERELADFLADRLLTSKCRLERFDVESMRGDAPEGCGCPQNLLFSWGKPRVLFCTHLDTVPPYIPPHVIPSEQSERGNLPATIQGRGTCDAKGQIFAMYEACLELERRGYGGFGLLLLAGEETGSFGAKSFRDAHPGAEWVVVG